MTLNEKLATIQTKFKSKKSRFNSFGKYYFRSAEDILEATKPFLKAAAKSKPMLDINTDAFNKAVEYIKAGGTMNAINTKYKVSVPAKAQLKKYEQE